MKKTLFFVVIAAVAAACAPKEQAVEIVPYPNSIEIRAGTFNAAGADIRFAADMDEASCEVIKVFADQLALVTGQASTINGTDASTCFRFIHDTEVPEEAYRLKVNRKSVIVKASSFKGFNYAIQTLKQMLPVEIYGKTSATDKDWSIACCRIEDAPRFAYRGEHLDEARHFYGNRHDPVRVVRDHSL